MKKKDNNTQAGGITDKKDINAGSGAFNQGSEQDPNYNDGTKVSDEEKQTGHTPSAGKARENSRKRNIEK